MCFQNENDLEKSVLEQPKRHNLKKAEITALNSLKNNPAIIIKQADKVSAVVIQNRDDYINEGRKQLNEFL